MLKTLLGLVAMGGTGVKLKKKMVVASVVGVVALVAAVPAFADCVNPSRSDKANVQLLAHAPDQSPVSCGFEPCTPFLTLDEAFLALLEAPIDSFPAPWGLGLCEPRAQYLVSKIDAAAAGLGINLTWVVGGHAVQSGGQENASNPRVQKNFSNGKGIDLIGGYPGLAEVIDTNLDAALAVPC